MSCHSAHWIFSISITRSNLNIFRLFLKHWTQQIQSYNYVFQSLLSNLCTLIDSNEKRITTRWAITQRSESLQPHLLDQISMFFNYFESIKFSSFRATIMSCKVCEVVRASRLIQTNNSIADRKFTHSSRR